MPEDLKPKKHELDMGGKGLTIVYEVNRNATHIILSYSNFKVIPIHTVILSHHDFEWLGGELN